MVLTNLMEGKSIWQASKCNRYLGGCRGVGGRPRSRYITTIEHGPVGHFSGCLERSNERKNSQRGDNRFGFWR